MLFEAPELDEDEDAVLARIDELKAVLALRLHEPRRWTGSIRRQMFARAIQGSNTIEGYTATVDDVGAIVDREEPLDAKDETRLALEGYRDAMTYILQVAPDPDLQCSTQLIKSIHFMMTGYDLAKSPGRWRPGVVYVRNDETGEIVYEGAPAEQVPELMEELSGDLQASQASDPIVHAAMIHLNLVLVHPFRDGNGRMGRALQSLVLAKDGVLSPVFMSIEEYLGRNTDDYYRVLAEVGRGRWNPSGDVRPWIRFSLTAHLRQAATMARRIDEAERLWGELELIVDRSRVHERTVHALYDAAMGWRVRRSTYQSVLDHAGEPVSEQAATRDLKALVDAELLIPHGEKRGRFYSAGPVLMSLRNEMVHARPPRDEADPFAPPLVR
ncbi:MAG: Fic family protein [Actinomycetota bacterium]